ncbi:MAG: SAM-dependent methyltransferase, partial [Pseudohongiella sp.]
MTQTYTDATLLRPALYVVATPIGNLGDMSQRAIDTLKSVDLIAAEDTRHSGRLMQHFAIATRLVSYHEHSSSAREDAILRALGEGKAVALISDAGTPLISDP